MKEHTCRYKWRSIAIIWDNGMPEFIKYKACRCGKVLL